MKRLNKVIKESGVPAVFIESTVNPKLLKQLASDNDIKVGGELYADSIGDKDSPAPSYIDMLKYNTDVIVKALTAKPSQEVAVTAEEQGGSSWWLWGILGLLLVGGFLLVARMR